MTYVITFILLIIIAAFISVGFNIEAEQALTIVFGFLAGIGLLAMLMSLFDENHSKDSNTSGNKRENSSPKTIDSKNDNASRAEANRQEQEAREKCQYEKDEIRKENIDLVEDKKIQNILAFQSTVDDKLLEISQKLETLGRDKQNLESDLMAINAEILKIQESIDNAKKKKKPLFEAKKHFEDNQNKVLEVKYTLYGDEMSNYKRIEQKYKNAKKQVESLQSQYDDLCYRKQNDKYYIFSQKHGVLEKLEKAFLNTQSGAKGGSLPKTVEFLSLPSTNYDMKSFAWKERPFSIRIENRCYLFTNRGILVFDKTGIYECVLPPISLKCDITQDKYRINSTLKIKIAMDEFFVTVNNLSVAEKLKAAIIDYQMLRIAFDPCFSIIELLGACSKANTYIEKMRNAEIVKGRHTERFSVKDLADENWDDDDESLKDFNIT